MTRTVGAVAAIALLVTACSSGDDTAGATTPSVPTAPSATTASTLPESTLPESTLPESALPETTAPATRPHGTRLDVEALAAWLDESAAANPTSPGELVTVLAPGTDVSAAGGSFDIGGDPLTADASFRIASVTKTFTAAATLRLVEIGALRLDDDLVSAGLPNELVELLRADGYDGTSITVAHLLDHSSGIYDYAFGDGSPYVSEVLADPAHVWTVGEQVAFATAHGDPLGARGR
ncbi:MAG: serine hydrolase [Ilumatobacteraceae bacterium]